MTVSLQQTDTAATDGNIAACSGLTIATGPDNRQATVGGAAGSTNHTVTVEQNNIGRELFAFETAPGMLDAYTIPSGNWVVRLNIITGGGATWNVCYICRVNSSGVSQSTIASSTSLAVTLQNAGVVSATLSGSADTASPGDRIYIALGVKNPGPGNHQVIYKADQLIDTPLGLFFLPQWANLIKVREWKRRKNVIVVLKRAVLLPAVNATPAPFPQAPRIKVAKQFYPLPKAARYVIQPPTSSVVICRRWPRAYWLRFPTRRVVFLPAAPVNTLLTRPIVRTMRALFPIVRRGFFTQPPVTTYVPYVTPARRIQSRQTTVIKRNALAGLAGVLSSTVVLSRPPKQSRVIQRTSPTQRTTLIPGAVTTRVVCVFRPPRMLRGPSQVQRRPGQVIFQPVTSYVILQRSKPLCFRQQTAGLRRPMWIPSNNWIYVKEPPRPKHARVVLALTRRQFVPMPAPVVPVLRHRPIAYRQLVVFKATHFRLPGPSVPQPLVSLRQRYTRMYYPLRRPAAIVAGPARTIVVNLPPRQRSSTLRPGGRRTLVIPGATTLQPVLTREGARRIAIITQAAASTIVLARPGKQVRSYYALNRSRGIVQATRTVPIVIPARRIQSRQYYPQRRQAPAGLFSQTVQTVMVKSVKVVR